MTYKTGHTNVCFKVIITLKFSLSKLITYWHCNSAKSFVWDKVYT